MPRTIDDLGPDAYLQWIRDQEELKTSRFLVQEASPKGEVTVGVPIYTSYTDELFEIQRNRLPVGEFAPPPHLLATALFLLFSYRALIPGFLASTDAQDVINQRIATETERLHKDPNEDPDQAAQESKTLLEFIKTYSKLNEDLLGINSQRRNNQKG